MKKRKREFGETLERYEAEVDKYAQRSELSKRDEVAAQVTDLSQRLKEVRLLIQVYRRVQLASHSAIVYLRRKEEKASFVQRWKYTSACLRTRC